MTEPGLELKDECKKGWKPEMPINPFEKASEGAVGAPERAQISSETLKEDIRTLNERNARLQLKSALELIKSKADHYVEITGGEICAGSPLPAWIYRDCEELIVLVLRKSGTFAVYDFLES